MRTKAPLLALATLALATAPVQAHHGWSGYDSSQLVTLAGTVQSFTFTSPHALLMLQVQDGKVWEIVLAPPSRMTRRGLLDGSIKAGDSVTVAGYPHRTHPDEFRAERIVVAGNTVELR